RLALRSDNADRRLTPTGRSVGLVEEMRWARFQRKLAAIEGLQQYLRSTRSEGASLWDLLRRPDSDVPHRLAALPGYERDIVEAVAVDAKYEGYLARQDRLADLQRSLDGKRIPAGLDYAAIEHLRAEAREKLTAFQPATLGHASRLSGITPADITVLQVHLKRIPTR
ncbi:MAG: tRNA uridine-5-carboxymethylaminomethyl(34) synthesis enzyme MnmG, partial [Planctomycetes bacterium]|nr:tRNA uridine-5-carboxymethylaminomethyl(34) synthesis enzyme MnmG [Planctomycetota bacterium]